MLLNIGITLLSLVALNFFLLVFSCNKTTKKTQKESYPVIIKNTKKSTTAISTSTKTTTKKRIPAQLAPTGS